MEAASDHDTARVIQRLYAGLGNRDGEAMAACYAPDSVFSDPAFGGLRGEQVTGMWRMLCSRATSIEVELRDHGADGATGHAHWVARYPFAATGRDVVNDVRARFRFADGLIVEHRDEFDLERWADQALGTPGKVLGMTPLLGPLLRRQTGGQLRKFLAQSSTS